MDANGPAYPLEPRTDLKNHSETGFSWGWTGSEASQLALALLADALGDDKKALKHYQQFKNKRALLLQGRLHDNNIVATTGWQTDFLKQMGLGIPESLAGLAVDEQRAFIPRRSLIQPRRLDGARISVLMS